MSEAQTTQTVVTETNASAKPDAAVESARPQGDDLDTLLKDYDTSTAKPDTSSAKPEQTPGAADDLKNTLEQVKGYVTQAQTLQFKADMKKTVDSVRGDLPSDIFDDDLVEAYLDGEARKDPRLAKAWTDRHANPKQFEKVVAGLQKAFSSKFSKLPNREATEDREAVTAAVRGASNRAPEEKAPDFTRMSDAEFAAAKDKMFAR